MKYRVAVIAIALSIPAMAAPRWSFQESGEHARQAFDLRATKVTVVTPDTPFEDDGLADKLTLPLPDGSVVEYYIHPNQVLASALALRYPSIKTYSGTSTKLASDTGRFDITEQGFHGMFMHQGQTFYIDPLPDGLAYAVYAQKNVLRRQEADEAAETFSQDEQRGVLVEGNLRKRYAIAISATGEYTQYHGGTKVAALSAIATLLNRVNEVYRRDVGVEFQLVADNDKVIFTDPATDPFTNSTQDISINQQQQALLLTSEFDLGHVLTTSGGGLATMRSLCHPTHRSRGMTGAFNPSGDGFYIDYVAHELGHQLGADHTFNGTAQACATGRRTNSAWEPGSGSTIMGYSGLCGSENLQSSSTPFFHSKSIEQMRTLMASLPSCGTTLPSTNNAPVVDAGPDWVIPANTAFTLNAGRALDLDGNTLTYTWEQLDLGEASGSAVTMIDDGTRPLFRFVTPTVNPTRTLPAMSSLFAGTLASGEAWPTTNRDLNFRLTVRDGQGGVSGDEMVVRVVNTGTAFAITTPSVGSMVAGSNQTVTWNVANTDQPPINCTSVDLALTQDGGLTWADLAQGLPNNGAATVLMPASLLSSARLRLTCSNNIFFAINGVNQMAADPAPDTPVATGGNTSNLSSSGSSGGGSLGLYVLLMLGGIRLWPRCYGR